MPSLVVGGVTIKVAPGGISRDRLDNVDRGRAFDNTYRASQSGTSKRDFHFSTPPIPRVFADIYEGVLSVVAAQACSGDILGGTGNLLVDPVNFEEDLWISVGSTIGQNVIAAPDASTTADKLAEDGSAGQHNVFQSRTGGLGTYTFTVWVKSAERTKCVIALSDNVAGGVYIGVDLTNGSTFASGVGLGSWTATSSLVTAYPNGWYLVTVTGTRGAGTETAAGVIVWTTALSYTGSAGSGIYVWGAQLKATPVNCCSEITGWTPVAAAGGQYVVLSFVLHEE